MKIDVYFTPLTLQQADLAGRSVVVLDVLRATTSIVVAIAAGARAVLPAASTEEALRLAQNLERDDVVLAGERRSQRVPGFLLGNSPAEFTADTVRGKTVVLATTNGTPALVQTQGAREVMVGAAVNLAVVAGHARATLAQTGELVVLCAGQDKHFALEDAFAAGRFVKLLLPEGGLKRVDVNDAALASLDVAKHYGERWLRAFRASTHGRHLVEQGFGEDLQFCGSENTHPVLPLYADRRVTAHRPAPEG
jgi:2-phosphosulfolactate phosphatase